MITTCVFVGNPGTDGIRIINHKRQKVTARKNGPKQCRVMKNASQDKNQRNCHRKPSVKAHKNLRPFADYIALIIIQYNFGASIWVAFRGYHFNL